MSELHGERRLTLKLAAIRLAFPNSEALRVWLARRPGLVGTRHVRTGRSYTRLLTESECDMIATLREHEAITPAGVPRNPVKSDFTRTLERTLTRTQSPRRR